MSGHDLLEPWKDVLLHPFAAFDPKTQEKRLPEMPHPYVVETFGWDYELLAQIEARLNASTLYGGACAALHLDLGEQRASVDVDIYWSRSEDEFRRVLTDIEQTMGRDTYFHFMEREVTLPHTTLRLIRFFTRCPSAAGHRDEDGLNGSIVKLDVAIAAPVDGSATALPDHEVLPFRTTSHQGLQHIDVLATKLLTLAGGEVGVPPDKGAALAKQVYDVTRLESALTSEDDVLAVGERMRVWLGFENLWLPRRSAFENCVNQIRATLEHMRSKQRREEAKAFAATYLQRRYATLDWDLLQVQVEHLALSASGRASPRDYLRARAAMPLLLARDRYSESDRRKMVKDLAAIMEKLDPAAGTAYRTCSPAELFWRVSARRRTDDALTVCAPVLT